MIRFRLSAPTPSLNPSSGASGNWRARHAGVVRLKRKWAQEIHAQLYPNIHGRNLILRARITIERHAASNGLDLDNLYGGVKPLIDVLKPMHPTKNKIGLGIIWDDSPDKLELIVRQVKCARADACTWVEITSL